MADPTPLCFCSTWAVNWPAVEGVGTIAALGVAILAPQLLQRSIRRGALKDARKLAEDIINVFLDALAAFKDDAQKGRNGKLVRPETVSSLHAADDTIRFGDTGAFVSPAARLALMKLHALSLQAINLADRADIATEQLSSSRGVALIDHLIAEAVKIREVLKNSPE
jgi:hypothetical protein